MKILLCVDSSENSEAAVQVVATQYPPQKTEVRVFHVLQPVTLSAAPQMDPMYTPELAAEGSEARKLVDRVAAQLRNAGFKAQPVVAKGDIRESIVDTAEQWPADLIVVGSHGHGGPLRRILLGSVAEFVARQAPCSVLIARSDAARSK
ncbi:MAG: universal stress protein [Acidobacteriota bacterium]|nr:universal stress protein [Acidobacteriota bacterium]MDE3170394.1 universal stress protein [Acidobacteriota bacterium]